MKVFIDNTDNAIGRSLSNAFETTEDIKEADYILITGGVAGGIKFNTEYPCDLIMDNIIKFFSKDLDFKKPLIFFAASCCYADGLSQPLREDDLFRSHPLYGYARAKLLIMDYIIHSWQQHNTPWNIIIPANVFGCEIEEHENIEYLHVIPSMIKEIAYCASTDAKNAYISNLAAKRDFIHSDDVVSAIKCIINCGVKQKVYNVGTGKAVSIGNLARTIAEVIGFKGSIISGNQFPGGVNSKVLDCTRIHTELGWRANITLEEGLERVMECE